MVRQLDMEMDNDAVENKHPGCIWGIFRALNYNIWQKNARKMLPCRKNRIAKYSNGTRRRKMRLIAYDSEESRIPASSSTRKSSSTNKRTFRTRIKSLISKVPSKEAGYKQMVSVSPTQLRSQQIYGEVDKLNKQQNCGKHNKSGRKHVSNAYEAQEEIDVVDVLEMYRVNKNLFSKISKYTDGGIAKSFCNLATNEARAKLTRSYSYPSPKLSQGFKFTKLDYKQNEIWSHLKNDKLFTNRQQVIDVRTKYTRKKASNELYFEKPVQLLPKSIIGEPTLSSSKSSRLNNEYSFKRVRSLSRIDLYGAFQNELTCDGHSTDLDSNRNSFNDSRLCEYVYRYDNSMNDSFNLEESINKHDKAKLLNFSEEAEGQIVVPKDLKKNEETDFIEDHDEKLPHSSSLLEFQSNSEDVMSLTVFLASRDFEWENNSFDKESPVDSEKCDSESLPRFSTTSNKKFNNNVDDDFHYVSNILDRSGFNDLLAPWYSLDHPLNPLVFDEVESRWHHKDLSTIDESCCHHQLLFDLINEVLVQIYDTSFTYYPRGLSSNCRVPPMPTKYNMLEELWGKVNKIMNPKLGSNMNVEAIVAKDIWTDDHWMNQQLESECLALELEDMLFEEFLEDIICPSNSQSRKEKLARLYN